jgi:hypothetical protein
MAKYAEHTDVPIERSVSEIERTLDRYGCEAFSYMRRKDAGAVEFEMRGRRVRIIVPLPDRNSPEFTTYKQGGFRYQRADEPARKLWEQACRQRWRALLLVIKAKLEAIDAGISTFDQEFLAQLVLPGGPTVIELVRAELEERFGRLELEPPPTTVSRADQP